MPTYACTPVGRYLVRSINPSRSLSSSSIATPSKDGRTRETSRSSSVLSDNAIGGQTWKAGRCSIDGRTRGIDRSSTHDRSAESDRKTRKVGNSSSRENGSTCALSKQRALRCVIRRSIVIILISDRAKDRRTRKTRRLLSVADFVHSHLVSSAWWWCADVIMITIDSEVHWILLGARRGECEILRLLELRFYEVGPS
jgi:hypothetical protein